MNTTPMRQNTALRCFGESDGFSEAWINRVTTSVFGSGSAKANASNTASACRYTGHPAGSGFIEPADSQCGRASPVQLKVGAPGSVSSDGKQGNASRIFV